MKQYKKEITEEYLGKIISAAYRDGNLFDRIKIHMDAKKDEKVSQLLIEYRTTANEVHSIAKEGYRGTVKNTEALKHKFLTNSLGFIIYRPAISSAIAAACIMIVFAVTMLNKPKPEPTYTKAQVEQAAKQVNESFAIIASVLRRSSNEITDDVLKKKVGGQLQKGVSIINDVLKERIVQ
jgi:hypothetical protein